MWRSYNTAVLYSIFEMSLELTSKVSRKHSVTLLKIIPPEEFEAGDPCVPLNTLVMIYCQSVTWLTFLNLRIV